MMFTGQVLLGHRCLLGVGIGAAMAGRVLVVGPMIVHLLLGGEVIGGDTLSRFFARTYS